MIFNFKTFLKRYEQPLKIIDTPGQYDENTGQWVPGEETEIEINCPVVPLTDNELIPAEGGNYTAEDRKIYVHDSAAFKEAAAIINNNGKSAAFSVAGVSLGASGNGVQVVFANTGSAGLSASYDAKTKVITINYGSDEDPDVVATAEQIVTVIKRLDGFAAAVIKDGDFAAADSMEITGVLLGGYDGKLKRGQKVITGGKRYVVDREKDYSKHASGLRVYVIVQKGEAND